jgi:hypothetical protein
LSKQGDTSEDSIVENEEPIDLDGITNLTVEDLKLMGENVEEEGEVIDLYHEKPAGAKKKLSEPRNAAAQNGESTPTKANWSQPSPEQRRSPRCHEKHGSVFIILKLSITDLHGVDERLDIPKVLIFAHNQTEKGQTVGELRECLEDTSNDRLAAQFDLCKLAI